MLGQVLIIPDIATVLEQVVYTKLYLYAFLLE